MARLTLTLLGHPELRRDETSVAFPTRKTLALLAHCVLEPTLHPRAKLANMFWPDSDDARARGALRYTLTQLRSAFVDDEFDFVSRRDAVGFERAPQSIDVDVFALERACERVRAPDGTKPDAAQVLALADGELMDGFSLPDCAPFEQWLLERRSYYARRAEALLRDASEACEAHGDLDGALRLAERWRAKNTLDEAAHQRVMRVLLARGERHSVAEAYERCRACLTEVLGTEPSEETVALVRRAESASGAGAAPASRATRATPRVSLALEMPLVGRESELSVLMTRYRSACEGRVEIVVLAGESGIGKTRLATDFAAWAAAQGADVLQGRAFETGGRLPYQPLVDALRLRIERENAPDDLLEDVWLTELSRLLVELRERYPDLAAPGPEDAASRIRLFEALARLVAAFAERAPVLLVLDDIQWADVASLDVVHYAVRRWNDAGARILLLFPTSGIHPWLVGGDRGIRVERVELGPLRADDTRKLVHLLSDSSPSSDDFAKWLHRETGGQPFFIAETLRALLAAGRLRAPARDEAKGSDARRVLELHANLASDASISQVVPPEIRQLVRARLERLEPHARTLLVAAAVLGRTFTFEEVRRVAHLSENEALDAMDELVRSQIVRESALRPAGPAASFFTHDKVRDVVYGDATDARRRVFHRRAVELLEERRAPAGEIARHALAAGLEQTALDASMAAGADAIRVLAAPDAIRLYTSALDLATRLGNTPVALDARIRRAKARASIAQWSAARGDFESVLEDLGPGDPERRAELLVSLSEAQFWSLDVPALHASSRAAAALAAETGRSDLEMAALGWMGGAASADGDLDTAIADYDRALAIARRADARPPSHLLSMHSEALHWRGRSEEAVVYARAAVAAAREAHDVSAILYSLSQLCLPLGATGDFCEASRIFAESRRYGREYALDSFLARAIAIAGGLRLDTFDFAGAEELAREASELARAADFVPAAASASIDLLYNFVRRGDVAKAERLVPDIAEIVARAAGFHAWLWRLRLEQGRAEIAVARADWRAAAEHATSVVTGSVKFNRVKYRILGLTTRARAFAQLGRRDDAIADLHEALPLSRATKDGSLLLRVASALLPLAGDDAILADANDAVRRISVALDDEGARTAFHRGVRDVLGLPAASRLR